MLVWMQALLFMLAVPVGLLKYLMSDLKTEFLSELNFSLNL